MIEQFELGQSKKVLNRVFHWKSLSTSSEITRRENFWVMKTNVRLQTALNLLKLMFLHGELNLRLQACILDHPSTLSDEIFRAIAVAKVTKDVNPEVLMDNLDKILSLIGKPNIYRKRLIRQWLGTIGIQIKEISQPIVPSKRYTGYVRNSSSVGSKRQNKISFEPIPEKFASEMFEMFDLILESITVGEVVSRSGNFTITLKSLKEAKRNTPKI